MIDTLSKALTQYIISARYIFTKRPRTIFTRLNIYIPIRSLDMAFCTVADGCIRHSPSPKACVAT